MRSSCSVERKVLYSVSGTMSQWNTDKNAFGIIYLSEDNNYVEYLANPRSHLGMLCHILLNKTSGSRENCYVESISRSKTITFLAFNIAGLVGLFSFLYNVLEANAPVYAVCILVLLVYLLSVL